MKKVLFIVFTSCILSSMHSQTQRDSIYFIGHSLVSFIMPKMLQDIANDAENISTYVDQQMINGAPLQWQWTFPGGNPNDEYYNPEVTGDWQLDLGTGQYNTLIITERVPLANAMEFHATHDYANNFYNYFFQNRSSNSQNPRETRMYIYETWDDFTEDLTEWRQLIDNVLPLWEGIADHLNNLHSETEVLMVPGGQAMARLYDAIENNEVPGITSIRDFFLDDIHPNEIGRYYIACVVFATVYGRSPVGLTLETNGPFEPYDTPSAALGLKLQELAYETVCNYSRSGVDCGTLSTDDNYDEYINSIYPNPIANNSFNINLRVNSANLKMYDVTGKEILHRHLNQGDNQIELNTALSTGLYIIKIQMPDGNTITKKMLK